MEPLGATELSKKIDAVSKPVLTWFGGEGSERIELSGAVARRWIAKTDNFMSSEFPFGGQSFSILLPHHWRTPFWLLVSWMRGMKLEGTLGAANTDMVVSADLGFLKGMEDQGGPDVLVAQTLDSFSLGWPEKLPSALLDGTADVMSHGDWVEDPYTAKPGTTLVSESVEWVAPDLWSNSASQSLPIEMLRDTNLIAVLPVEELNGSRVLVRTDNSVLFAAQLAQLWMAGAQVVWAPKQSTRQDLLDRERCDLVLPNS